jgi:excisionase family DNA binding protein
MHTKFALSVAEACAAGGFGKTAFYEAIKSGALRAVKHGKRTVVLPADLQRFLENLPAITPQKNPEMESGPSQPKADELCGGRSVVSSGKVRAR